MNKRLPGTEFLRIASIFVISVSILTNKVGLANSLDG